MNAIAQYLNTCVSANIKTSIQNTLHLAEYDITAYGEVVATAIKQSIRHSKASPLFNTKSSVLQTTPNNRTTINYSVPEVKDTAVGASSEFEKNSLEADDVVNIQSNLCAKNDGKFGPQTRESIKNFEAYYQYLGIPDDRIDGELASEEFEAILALGQCPNSIYSGYLERSLFDLNGNPHSVFIQKFQRSLNVAGAKNTDGDRIIFAEDAQLASLLDRKKLKLVNQHLLKLSSSRINSRLYMMLVQSYGLPQ
ncbi:MAG: peptidoglycan-binding domain-containing protein [Desulfobulbia bacterium]